MIFLFSALWGYLRLLIQVKGYQRKDVTVADVFEQNCSKHPNKPCILFEDQEWTFSQVIELSLGNPENFPLYQVFIPG